MTFSLLQGCDGQAIAVDLRTDVHHPPHRHPRLLRAHRRHPHAAHRRIAGAVQHSDAAVAHLLPKIEKNSIITKEGKSRIIHYI